MKFLLFMVIATFVLAVKCQNLTEVVKTNKGPVQGITLTTVYHHKAYSAFFGIPFAKPPVGDLRFQPPVEPNSWSEVLNATQESPLCPQMLEIENVFGGNEDCLYLNVYTPLLHFTNIKPLKPVVVWIYGGGFEAGTTAKSVYGPDRILEEDIVLVDMNYRLNILGFLALEIPGATGNQGLKDQNLALQWVQKNIAKFGGNPDRVTIMGESAGAVSMTYHMISPKSRGLFHQVIIQSGSALAPWGYKSPTASKWTAYELAKRINITAKSDSDLLASLKKADVKPLIKAAASMTNHELPVPLRIAFVPTSESGDDAFISDCPISYFESGNFSHVPTMLGYTAEETILYSIGLDKERYEVQEKLLSLTKVLDLTGHNNLMINVMNSVVNDTVWEIIKASSIYVFSGPVDLTQRYLVKHNGNKPVYFFRLSYRSNQNYHLLANPHINGTSHADDLPLIFHMENFPTDPNHQFNRYSQRVVSMWANFIKSGNPTPSNSNVSGARWITSRKQGFQLDIGNGKFVMQNRFIVSRDAAIEQAYYNGLPVTSQCKNYPFGNPSLF
ncbi:cholinesterase-like [Colletes latitarsis]|uniref:cholinesterase-like n=1 Tax=Colletes latitarsis TaxID=2605962 RepID=UPI004036A7D0